MGERLRLVKLSAERIGASRYARSFLALALVVGAGALRFWTIDQPAHHVFDEQYYAIDACRYLDGTALFCGPPPEVTWWHPPLGKWLMAVGIWSFAPTPLGWRVMPVLFGTLGVAAVYWLGKMLTGRRGPGLLAAALLALDPLHFVMSRRGMLDVFAVTFMSLAFAFVVKAKAARGHREDESAEPEQVKPTGLMTELRWPSRLAPWSYLAGAAGGAAVASKWSVAPAVVAAMTLGVAWDRAARVRFRRTFVAYLLLPVLVYSFTFVGRIEGRFPTSPMAEGSWYRAFAMRQFEMAEYLGRVEVAFGGSGLRHPYASPAWSWPLTKRPQYQYFALDDDERRRHILATGNPLLWMAGLMAAGALSVSGFRARRGEESVRTVGATLGAGVAGGYLVWLLIPRGHAFIYYFLAALPFVSLSLAIVLMSWWRRRAGRVVVVGVAALAVTTFWFLHPVLVGRPLPDGPWRARMLLEDCTPIPPEDRLFDVARGDVPLPPPASEAERVLPSQTLGRGWCWI